MENSTLPLSAIQSGSPVVVFSQAANALISQHAERGAALKTLSKLVEQNPDTDAAIYERGTGWECILRCPVWHQRWLEEATARFAKKKTTHS